MDSTRQLRNHRSPPELRKFVSPEFVFGAGSLSLVGQYTRNLGAHRPLIVTDAGVEAAGWTPKVIASIEASGLAGTVFKHVSPNPRVEEVSAGAACYAEQDRDAIIAIGGGSVIDCAKAIGVVSANGGDIRDFEGIDSIGAPMPPTICIPTTSGTSADVSQFAVITDLELRRKFLIISKAVVPDLALIDPDTLTTMDPHLTACTGMDALTHAIEAYVSLGNSPVTDVHSIEAVRLISANLLKATAEPHHPEYRRNMMMGSLHAGLAFSNASLGAVHAMAHSLGGVCDLPHGQCNALLFDHVIRFNFPEAEPRYRDIAIAMGLHISGLSGRKIRDLLANEIRRLREAAGIRETLADVGVARAEVPALAEAAMQDLCVVTNPRRPCQRDLEVLYEESL